MGTFLKLPALSAKTAEQLLYMDFINADTADKLAKSCAIIFYNALNTQIKLGTRRGGVFLPLRRVPIKKGVFIMAYIKVVERTQSHKYRDDNTYDDLIVDSKKMLLGRKNWVPDGVEYSTRSDISVCIFTTG